MYLGSVSPRGKRVLFLLGKRNFEVLRMKRGGILRGMVEMKLGE